MQLPNRKHNRLAGYDYSKQNFYFVTICTRNKSNLFYCENELNNYGLIAEKELKNIHKHFEGVWVDKYVIMPNHIHAVIVIGCNGVEERSRPFPTLSTVVGLYKSGVSRQIHKESPNIVVWQKSFYDEIIRNENAYLEVLQYIEENPLKRTK